MSSPDTYYKDLQNLGITAWLPRQPLVNAAPTPDWVFDYRFGPTPAETRETNTAAPRSSARPTTKGDAKAHLAKLRSVLDASEDANKTSTLSNKSARPSPKTVKPSSAHEVSSPAQARQGLSRVAMPPVEPVATSVKTKAAAPTEATPVQASTQPVQANDQAVPRFQLAFMCYGPLLVIDAVPPNAKDGFSPLHRLLQQKIVESLGVYEPASEEVAYLRWPLFDRPGIDQSRPEAVKAVKRKLDWVYKKQAPRYVLVMGEAAAQIIYERQEPIHALKGIEFTLKGNEPMVKAYATHSLSEALQLDWVKPEIWADVQPLLRKLKADALAKGRDQ